VKVDEFTAAIDNPYWALLFGTLATARAARLVVFDEYPPMLWLRTRYLVYFGTSKWAKLVECAFCAAPYLAAINMAYAYFSDFHWTWWVLNIWAALSYVAAIVVARDEPEE
jgi:hypothetical protein